MCSKNVVSSAFASSNKNVSLISLIPALMMRERSRSSKSYREYFLWVWTS